MKRRKKAGESSKTCLRWLEGQQWKAEGVNVWSRISRARPPGGGREAGRPSKWQPKGKFQGSAANVQKFNIIFPFVVVCFL